MFYDIIILGNKGNIYDHISKNGGIKLIYSKFKGLSKENKYHNRKITIDNITFDSKLEAKRYTELKLLEKQGLIKNLILQPSYELIPSFKKNNKTFRKTCYNADFSYYDVNLDKTIVEDTKGFKTDVYKIKKKLFEYHYPDFSIKEKI